MKKILDTRRGKELWPSVALLYFTKRLLDYICKCYIQNVSIYILKVFMDFSLVASFVDLGIYLNWLPRKELRGFPLTLSVDDPSTFLH